MIKIKKSSEVAKTTTTSDKHKTFCIITLNHVAKITAEIY